MLKKIILIILLTIFIYSPSKNIYKKLYTSIKICADLNNQCYKKSFNYLISKEYKAYANHVGGGNLLGYYFANKVIQKYYSYDNFSSPIFFNLPYESGVKILLDGYRHEPNTVKNEFIIRNYNSLYEHKNIGIKGINVHGFFIDLNNSEINGFININNKKKFEVNKKNLITCEDFNNSRRPFLSLNHDIENKNLNRIKKFKNCFYFELKNNKGLNYTLKLFNSDIIKNININSFLFYGNNLDIEPYAVLERSFNNYNYFYSRALN